MRQIFLIVVVLTTAPIALPAHADGVLYRCESDAGISIQGTPCPKGNAQRKIAMQGLTNATPTPAPTPAPKTPATPAAAPAMPITPSSAMHGPNDPYPLWQCMRADGSTFDSRTGIPGKQWVPKAEDPDAAADPSVPPNVASVKKGQHIVRPYVEASVATVADKSDAAKVDTTPPPSGAAPGQWVADQCTQLDSQHACDRFATRRDALRKQIYTAKPSERATYAPEEQDLTTMLYAACGR